MHRTNFRDPEKIRQVWDIYFDSNTPRPSDPLDETEGWCFNLEEVEDVERWHFYPDVIRNLEQAHALMKAYRDYEGVEFDIVEVTKDQQSPTVGTKFLGYDVSYAYDESLILNMLRVPVSPSTPEAKEIIEFTTPLYSLMRNYFVLQLNKNGLFTEYEQARLCLDCENSIFALAPAMYESEAPDYEVVGIYKVADAF